MADEIVKWRWGAPVGVVRPDGKVYFEDWFNVNLLEPLVTQVNETAAQLEASITPTVFASYPEPRVRVTQASYATDQKSPFRASYTTQNRQRLFARYA